ncbi:MAG: hypothetical protein GF368_03835 [Candidatus Aenigmarchaeota archaeon]|nr:hypothetical protein [Candidatus Aenigmarchaeota archaeon]
MRKIIVLLTTVLILLTGTFAQNHYFDLFYVKTYLGGGDISRNIIEANIVALEPLQEIVLELPENFADVRAEDIQGNDIDITIVENDLTIYLDPLEKGRSTFVKITYFTDDSVSFINDNRIFTYAFTSPSRIKDFRFTIFLPLKATITMKNGTPLVYPRAEIDSDGEKISVKYKETLEQGQEFSTLITYNLNRNHTYLLFLLGLFSGALIVWFFLKRRNNRRINVRVSETLDEDEKLIYDLVRAKDGILQKEIVQLTNFSKSKASKVIRELEKKNIVKKEPYRKTNKIFLR